MSMHSWGSLRSEGEVGVARQNGDGGSARERTLVFDFGDGPVDASRHVNPDGSQGGWVAFTAHVDPGARIAPGARVFGNARVFDVCEVRDEASVCDTARIYGRAVVADRAVVRGDATVADAEIRDDAIVEGRARVARGAQVAGRARVRDDAKVIGAALVHGDAVLDGRAWITSGELTGETDMSDPSTAARPSEVPTSTPSIETQADVFSLDDVEELLDFS